MMLRSSRVKAVIGDDHQDARSEDANLCVICCDRPKDCRTYPRVRIVIMFAESDTCVLILLEQYCYHASTLPAASNASSKCCLSDCILGEPDDVIVCVCFREIISREHPPKCPVCRRAIVDKTKIFHS